MSQESNDDSLQIQFFSKLDLIGHIWHVLSTVTFACDPQRVPGGNMIHRATYLLYFYMDLYENAVYWHGRENMGKWW